MTNGNCVQSEAATPSAIMEFVALTYTNQTLTLVVDTYVLCQCGLRWIPLARLEPDLALPPGTTVAVRPRCPSDMLLEEKSFPRKVKLTPFGAKAPILPGGNLPPVAQGMEICGPRALYKPSSTSCCEGSYAGAPLSFRQDPWQFGLIGPVPSLLEEMLWPCLDGLLNVEFIQETAGKLLQFPELAALSSVHLDHSSGVLPFSERVVGYTAVQRDSYHDVMLMTEQEFSRWNLVISPLEAAHPVASLMEDMTLPSLPHALSTPLRWRLDSSDAISFAELEPLSSVHLCHSSGAPLCRNVRPVNHVWAVSSFRTSGGPVSAQRKCPPHFILAKR